MASPARRRLAGQIGAFSLHSKYDSKELTANARKAFQSKFERQVDPDGILEPQERARRADALRSAHYKRLSLKRWHGGSK